MLDGWMRVGGGEGLAVYRANDGRTLLPAQQTRHPQGYQARKSLVGSTRYVTLHRLFFHTIA